MKNKIPFGIIAGASFIVAFYTILGFIASFIILNAIASQTNTTVSMFENWWQVLLFVIAIIATLTAITSLIFFIITKNKENVKVEKTFKERLFVPSIWTLSSSFFGILFVIFIVGGFFASTNAGVINAFLEIEIYQKTEADPNANTEYFKSDYYWSNGTYDHEYMRKHSLELAREVAVEGSVLLWNNNNTLPLQNGSKISLFGITAVKYMTSQSGSGHVDVNEAVTMYNTFEDDGASVNKELWDTYESIKNSYGSITGNFNNDQDDKSNYWDFKVNEAPWSAISSGTTTISQYGDAAIMFISRNSGEGSDTSFYESDCIDGNYLDLSNQEVDILHHLEEYKKNGTIKNIVLILNTASAMQFKNIRNFDIDACIWAGIGGNSSYWQVADMVMGKTWPSDNWQEGPMGHLSDTYVFDNDSAPAVVNTGNFSFEMVNGVLPPDQEPAHNRKYMVYQEGIYVGYRYYETRYEDFIMRKGNASSNVGVTSGKNSWSYQDEVAFPFGYGGSYTTFERSNFNVIEKDDSYEVSIKIKNTGNYGGKEVLQVYLQKPYTDYDKMYNIEKSAIELVGFAKTDYLQPNQEETLTVIVPKKELRTYDAYNKKTYILEKGDYYLSVGEEVHDALNNILAKKGYGSANGMIDFRGNPTSGNKDLTYKITINEDDDTIYSTSLFTNYKITNQFNDADVNLYEGTNDQKVTYLSRNNWEATYPKNHVKLSILKEQFYLDMLYSKYNGNIPDDPNLEMPKYSTVGEYGKLTLASLMKDEEDNIIPITSPLWDALLDQTTFDEQQQLILLGSEAWAGANSIAAPGAQAHDGPCGISIVNPLTKSYMAFPCANLQASTFDVELVRKMNDAFGMEILHTGFTGIYGPGANIHRTAYGGRNWEYYSEDPVLSSKMLEYASEGLVGRGAIVTVKHFALNEQERNRYGGAMFANEQAIRELYLRAFEDAIGSGKINAVMSSFNRIGATYSGKHYGLLTEVLRNEWGFGGFVESDYAVAPHMTDQNAIAEALLAGQDNWMSPGYSSTLNFEKFKTNKRVCHAMREACKRILFVQAHSSAMNGVDSSTRIITITPWWSYAILSGQISSGIITTILGAMSIYSFIYIAKKKKQEEGE